MGGDDRGMLFETYKLHAELAERVASLRESLSKLYSGMVTSIVAASVLLHKLAPGTETIWVLYLLGILVSLSWMLSLHSVTGRLAAKHKVLMSLEKDLPYNFLDRETEEFEKRRFFRRKYTGLLMPLGFLILCVIGIVIFCLNSQADDGESCQTERIRLGLFSERDQPNAQGVYQLSP